MAEMPNFSGTIIIWAVLVLPKRIPTIRVSSAEANKNSLMNKILTIFPFCHSKAKLHGVTRKLK